MDLKHARRGVMATKDRFLSGTRYRRSDRCLRLLPGLILVMTTVALISPKDLTAQVLRWGLKTGDRIGVTLEQSMSASTECNTLKSLTETSIVLELEWRVTSSADDEFQLEQTVQRIQMVLSTPTEDRSNRIEIDTEKDDRSLRGVAREVRSQLLPLVGQAVQVRMSRRGEILEVTLGPDFQEAIRGASSSTPLRELFSEQGLSDLFRQTTFLLPEQEVTPGFQWTTQTAMEGSFGPLALRSTYEFQGIETIDGRDYQKFVLSQSREPPTSEIVGQSGAPLDSADPPPKLVSLTGSGTFYFDRELGLFSLAEAGTEVVTQKQYRDLTMDTQLTGSVKMNLRKK